MVGRLDRMLVEHGERVGGALIAEHRQREVIRGVRIARVQIEGRTEMGGGFGSAS